MSQPIITLCDTGKEYVRARKFLRQHEPSWDRKLDFPTLFLTIDNHVMGVCGTDIHDGLIILSPLIVDEQLKPRRNYAILLLLAYEQVLANAGVTQYHFAIQRENHGWLERMLAIGFQPFQENENELWFVRDIHNPPLQELIMHYLEE